MIFTVISAGKFGVYAASRELCYESSILLPCNLSTIFLIDR